MSIELVRGRIIEFDMRAAGPSILAERKLISETLYQDLLDSDGTSRNISIGKAMIDTKVDEMKLSEIIDNDIKRYVKEFISSNNLKSSNVLEVARDAVFVYNASPKKLRFGDFIFFRDKNRYSMMISFPISENNNNKVKIYKRVAGLKIRGAKFNEEHPSYLTLISLLLSIENRDSKSYIKGLKRLSLELKSSDRLINSIENEHLINVLKEIGV